MRKKALCVRFNSPKLYSKEDLIVGKYYMIESMVFLKSMVLVFDNNEKLIGSYPENFFKTKKELRKVKLNQLL